MIKKPKKQLYKPFLSIAVYTVLFFFLYIFLPVSLARLHYVSTKLLAAFYLANILLAFYSLNRNSRRGYALGRQIQKLQEETNLLNDRNCRELKSNIALRDKISRYNSLKKIIEEINQNLSLESIANSLAEIAFSLIANNKGVCILYLVDSQTQKLNLFKTKKEDKGAIIKAKEGDIFDLWVLRHAQALLMEDIKKDFRFDLEKLESEQRRPVSSLISAPFIISHRFLGILRLDNPGVGFYTQDDLRFLVTICDLGAVALENGEYFEKTQDLAIRDGLTSLYTKGYFLERLKEECIRSLRQNTSLTLLMLDIDYFKNYNDKFGHIAGDIVLKTLSNNIVDFLKETNSIIGRFGGEEFCVIIPGRNKKTAYTLVEGLRQSIEKTKIILRRQETNITVSIGTASFPGDARDEDELIFKADRAMYDAKQKGRNRVCPA